MPTDTTFGGIPDGGHRTAANPLPMKHILSYTRRALDDYGMIRSGERIAVGVSAGKDSLTLLCALARLRQFYPIPFELSAITVDMGFGGVPGDYSGIRDLCRRLAIPYRVVPSDIAEIVFGIRKEQNPCSLCAKMRRGALHSAAREDGCTAVALGHHFDDVVETFMLNLFYEGRIGCFSPVTELSRTGIRLIRPLIYVPEKEIRAYAAAEALPVVPSACPANEHTERENMKQLLRTLERNNRDCDIASSAPCSVAGWTASACRGGGTSVSRSRRKNTMRRTRYETKYSGRTVRLRLHGQDTPVRALQSSILL